MSLYKKDAAELPYPGDFVVISLASPRSMSGWQYVGSDHWSRPPGSLYGRVWTPCDEFPEGYRWYAVYGGMPTAAICSGSNS